MVTEEIASTAQGLDAPSRAMTGQNEDLSQAEQTFMRFDAYDFDGDAEFQNGLASILQSRPETSQETILLAKAFYYAKQVEPLDLQEYKAWKFPVRPLTDEEVDAALRQQSQTATLFNYDSLPDESPVPTSDAQPTMSDGELPYPASFAEIVELIKSGKPIPGIQHIPDKLAEEPESVSVITPRSKPWQMDANEPAAPSIFDSLPAETSEDAAQTT